MLRRTLATGFLAFLLLEADILLACDPADRIRQTPFVDPSAADITTSLFYQGWGYPRSSEVNTYNAECYPWRSYEGEFLLFGSLNLNGPARPGHRGGWDIYISRWDSIAGRWGEPLNPGPAINTPEHERRPSCNAGCDTLYFERSGDIYMSAWTGSLWTVAEALDYPVNSPDRDRHPAISFDGERLYFSSDRDSGQGGYDIWVAYRHGTVWDSVVNLGEPVNSPNEETRPFESRDGQRLYFSNNHGAPRPGGSYGGMSDIYLSTMTDSGWGPIGLVAAPVNCDLTACSPCESPDGNELWIGSEAWEGGRGDEDIWVATRGISPPPRTTYGYGVWRKSGELENAIYVYDLVESATGTVYAATACSESIPTGRVFRTEDGMTWEPCADLAGAMVVYSLLIAGDTLYAGTYPNGDVFRSLDGGDSWTYTADLPGATSARSLVRLEDGRILVGTSPYDAEIRNPIFESDDGGATWTELCALPGINPCKFIRQVSGGAIFAGGWGIDTQPMMHRSLDNGATWDSIGIMEQWEPEWTADGLLETSSGELYVCGWSPAVSPGEAGGYVYSSGDTGATWTECAKVMRGDGVHNCRVYALAEDDLGMLFAGMQPAADSVVYVSTDGGSYWYSIGGLDGAFECLCLLKASDGKIYAGTTPNGDVFRYDPQPGIDPDPDRPSIPCRLAQNRPNPFSSTTRVSFQVLKPGRVAVRIFNTLGEYITTLVDGEFRAGWHHVRFDGTGADGRAVASGVYVCCLETSDIRLTRKMVFIR